MLGRWCVITALNMFVPYVIKVMIIGTVSIRNESKFSTRTLSTLENSVRRF
jgi:6-phosphogluconate dehydrogenase (decarboxylating)